MTLHIEQEFHNCEKKLSRIRLINIKTIPGFTAYHDIRF